jgi:hypothetical protein
MNIIEDEFKQFTTKTFKFIDSSSVSQLELVLENIVEIKKKYIIVFNILSFVSVRKIYCYINSRKDIRQLKRSLYSLNFNFEIYEVEYNFTNDKFCNIILEYIKYEKLNITLIKQKKNNSIFTFYETDIDNDFEKKNFDLFLQI